MLLLEFLKHFVQKKYCSKETWESSLPFTGLGWEIISVFYEFSWPESDAAHLGRVWLTDAGPEHIELDYGKENLSMDEYSTAPVGTSHAATKPGRWTFWFPEQSDELSEIPHVQSEKALLPNTSKPITDFTPLTQRTEGKIIPDYRQTIAFRNTSHGNSCCVYVRKSEQ